MQSPLLKAFILLTFSLTAIARGNVQQQQVGQWVIGLTDDWASSGNYLIYSCGSQAPAIKSLLDLTYLYLQTALLSIDTPPYKAFFHSADPAAVQTILTTITEGTNISTPLYGSRRPNIVCANDQDRGIKHFWDLCSGTARTVLVQPPQTSIIFLCPLFFELAKTPEPDDCATVNRADTKLVRYNRIGLTQYSFLVQVLAEMYIREMMGGAVLLRDDMWDANACLALPADRAVRNPSSYAYYAGSECWLFFVPTDAAFRIGFGHC